MTKRILSFTLTAALLAQSAIAEVRQGPRLLKPAEHGIGHLIDNLAFSDLNGKAGRLADFAKHKALVIAFTSTTCPLTKKFAPELAKLEDDYAKRGVAFLYVNPTPSDDAGEQRAAAKQHGLNGPVVHDTDGRFAAALGALTTTDVFVLDAARTLVYRGAVSDQYGLGFAHDTPRVTYLCDALDAVLTGARPRIAATWAPGCELDRSPATTKTAAIAYHNRVSRILQANCVECHRKGGIGPFNLDNFKDVLGNAGMIRKVVREGLMPPWFAAPEKDPSAHVWANDRSLSAADKAELLNWLQNGKPEGDIKDSPLPLVFNEGWNIGEPDHVVSLPRSMAVKATGQMPYVNLFVKTEFTEDRWVTAMEVRPTAPEVVHHVLVFVIPRSEAGNLSKRDLGREDRGYLAAYVPGNSFTKYPVGFAKPLPAGATLHFQVHYTPNGTATSDRTRLGLRFAKEPPTNVIRVAGIADHKFRIPPRDPSFSSTKSIPISTPIAVTAFLPHMHLRGKAFRYDLIQGGKRTALLDVPHYDFNWQLRYEYAEPRMIPAGSRIEVTGTFDNSPGNPANPDPDKLVKWGPQTTDEMLLGYVEYYIPGTGTGSPADSLEHSPGGFDLAERFRLLDKNKDGLITPSELPQRLLFAQLDDDGNGEITLLEAGESLKAIGRKITDAFAKTEAGNRFIVRLFERLDGNKDGKLTDEEVPPNLRKNVAKGDLNRDGVLTRAELEKSLGGGRKR